MNANQIRRFDSVRIRNQLRSARIRPWQCLWRPWAPTNDEKNLWIERAHDIASQEFVRGNGVIDRAAVMARVREEAMTAGVGPLTWLWIVSMVIQLVKLLREAMDSK